MRRVFILIAAIALLTAACKIETNYAATLNADGTGTIAAEIGLDEEAQAFLQGEDPLADAPEDAETSTETRGDMTFYVATRTFSSPAELIAFSTEDDGLFSTFDATFTNTRVTVRGTTSDAGGGFFDDGDLEGFDPGLIEDSFSASVRITMPGKVLDSNADRTDGNTLIWDIPLMGGTVDVRAESDPSQSAGGGGGFPMWLIIVIVVVVVAAAGYFVMKQRTSGGGTTPAAAAPSGEAPPPPPPPVE